jgi:hypothetical protein
MADTTDPLRDKAVELIQVLQSTTPFTSATSARALCHHLVTNGKLSALRDLAASYDPKKSDVYEDIRNNHKEVRNGGDSLAASSLAMALSSQPGDEYGFVKSANRVGAQITRQTWSILLICTGQSHSFGAVVAPEFGPHSH